jgi:hypothetical protein
VSALAMPAREVLDAARDDSFGEMHAYCRREVGVRFDPASSILTVTVHAFDAATAQGVNRLLLEMGEALVNQLNERGRQAAPPARRAGRLRARPGRLGRAVAADRQHSRACRLSAMAQTALARSAARGRSIACLPPSAAAPTGTVAPGLGDRCVRQVLVIVDNVVARERVG